MDDSERSYGYSDDIYHGPHHRKDEKSYEYGAEDPEETQGDELSPEEQAIHIEGTNAGKEPGAAVDTGSYDYGREGGFASTESFTWNIPEPGVEREARASETKVRVDRGEKEGVRCGLPSEASPPGPLSTPWRGGT